MAKIVIMSGSKYSRGRPAPGGRAGGDDGYEHKMTEAAAEIAAGETLES